MAVLNKIRKQSLVLIVVIALALFSFVLADLFRNSDALTSKSQDVVATINGKDIGRVDFMNKVENMRRQLGPTATTMQAMNRIWDQEVRSAVMNSQFDAIGFTVEKDQMRDLLKTNLSNNPDFQNEAGIFDENKLNEYIANLKATSAVAYQQWVDYEKSIATDALEQNYNNMFKAGMIGTLAEGELEHSLEGNKVDLKYVQIPYSAIQDSTIAVSKAEITSYINANKKKYKVDATRDLTYVEFKEVASVEDEENIKAELAKFLTQRVEYDNGVNDTILPFSKVKDYDNYINFKADSDIKFNDSYVLKSALSPIVADTLFSMSEGEIYGPYKGSGYLNLTKVIARTKMPDSVKARHILIPFIGSNSATAETTQTEVQAKQTADSIMSVIKKDTSKFVSLLDFSVDKASNAKEGVLDWFTYSTMVPAFRDYSFINKTGDIGVVKSPFGFHVIEILGQKNSLDYIKVGTIAYKIEPSEETQDLVFREASNFLIAAKDGDFQTLAEERNLTARPVNGIKVLDENMPGIGNKREMVSWAFKEDTKIGSVKQFDIAGGYVIAQLTNMKEDGLMNSEDASVTALPAIRKKKKADLIKARITATTLEDVAAAENQTVKSALAINMKNPTISGAGSEPLVVGTAFGLNEGDTSGLIEGVNGLYIIQVTKATPAATLDNYQSFANQVGAAKLNTVNTRLFNALKEASEIEDNRASTVQ